MHSILKIFSLITREYKQLKQIKIAINTNQVTLSLAQCNLEIYRLGGLNSQREKSVHQPDKYYCKSTVIQLVNAIILD